MLIFEMIFKAHINVNFAQFLKKRGKKIKCEILYNNAANKTTYKKKISKCIIF